MFLTKDLLADKAEDEHQKAFENLQVHFSFVHTDCSVLKSLLKLSEQAVMANEGHYEKKYNVLKGRFKVHGEWIMNKLVGMKTSQAFDQFYDKVLASP